MTKKTKLGQREDLKDKKFQLTNQLQLHTMPKVSLNTLPRKLKSKKAIMMMAECQTAVQNIYSRLLTLFTIVFIYFVETLKIVVSFESSRKFCIRILINELHK